MVDLRPSHSTNRSLQSHLQDLRMLDSQHPREHLPIKSKNVAIAREER
jgi:hypothetical protein